jgi:hypothetical protein
MLQFANVLCDPPLGQSTVIPYSESEARFTVSIESSISFSEQPWEAVIWHNSHEDGRWDGLALDDVTPEEPPLAISTPGRPNVYRRYYQGTITRPKAGNRFIEFTLKYKTRNSDWKWVNEQAGLTNGEVLFQVQDLPAELEGCFEGFSPEFQVVSSSSSAAKNVWEVRRSIEAAGQASTFSNDTIGAPKEITRWFAHTRIWTPWLAARHGRSHFRLSEDGVVLSLLRKDGSHLVLVAVSGVGHTHTWFKDDGNGKIVLVSRNDGVESELARVVAAVSHDHNTALASCMYHIRGLVSGELALTDELQVQLKAHKKGEVDPRWMEEWYDGLTYCTWNGLGQGLTEKKIFDALDVLDENDIKVTNLIIDDNWQSLDNPGAYQDARGMTDFDANKEGFPRGLEATVTDIRDRHPSIEHVSVWHAILGYWGGISPGGNLAKKYKTKVVRKSAIGREPAGSFTVIKGEDAEQFYDDFYKFLLSCRVDSVKTDAQFFLDLLQDPEDRRDLMKPYQDAWTIASLKYFGTKAVSCMSLVPAIMFHTQLPTTKPRIMVRNSDDFFPEIPSSHPWHIFVNAYVSLLTQFLNVLPDWDMFQTSHPYSAFHAAARCVSGGPIYITDVPGQHDIDLINQMTAPGNRDGKRTILRPSTIGKTVPLGVYTSYDELRLLKVGTYHGHAGTGTGILGVFNVSPQALTEFVLLRDFPGVEPGQKYVIRVHSTGEISKPLGLGDDLALTSIYLDIKGSEVLTAYPLRTAGSISVAPLGLLGKLSGAAAIVGVPTVEESNSKLRLVVSVKALGVLGIYVSNLEDKTVDDNFMAMISKRAIPRSAVSADGKVFRIDLERAWKELKLPISWSNEVVVELLIT